MAKPGSTWSATWAWILAALAGLALAALAACAQPADDSAGGAGGGKADDLRPDLPAQVPSRIVMFIGDGMGVAHLSGGAYSSEQPLAMLAMPELGFVTTHEHEFLTTDSAAAATALSSGHKSHFGAIGVAPGTTASLEELSDHQLRTVFDSATDAGWRTGLVATTSLVDATPAAFAAHRASRSSKDDIAVDLRHAGVDVMIGGGKKHFANREDGQNLLDQLRGDGYSVATTATGLRRVSGSASKVIAVLSESDLPPVAERPMSLAEMTDRAISVLERDNADGYILMVEGSWIDRQSHALDGPGSLAEVREFDDAVAVGLARARSRDDMLVVVTADHETGGLALLDPADTDGLAAPLGGTADAAAAANFPGVFKGPPTFHSVAAASTLAPPEQVERALVTAYGFLSIASRPFFRAPTFVFSATHTSTQVAVFAEGPGADYIASSGDNAELGSRLRALVAADGQSAADPEPEPADERATNLILVITDRVALPGWTAASYRHGPLATTMLPTAGLIATAGLDRLVPDRGASATQLAAAVMTRAGAIGMAPSGSQLMPSVNLVDIAADSGRRLGLVTTAHLTDPAVAAFYDHRAGQAPASDIAAALIDAEPAFDLVFGGGASDISAAERQRWTDRGATVTTGWPAGAAQGAPAVRLIADGELDGATQRLAGTSDHPSLEAMTRAAIGALDGPDGFVLVIYAGGPAARADDLSRNGDLADELIDIDRAVMAALEHAAESGDTAIVVTSLRASSLSLIDNHYGFHKNQCGIATTCGGSQPFTALEPAIPIIPNGDGLDDTTLQGDFAPVRMHLQYAWLVQASASADPGSAELVPLFAAGPGTHALEGFSTMAEVGAVLTELFEEPL